MAYQFESSIESWALDYNYFYLPVPEDIASHFNEESRPRVVCLLNGDLLLHAALQKEKGGIYFIHMGMKTLKKLNLEAGDRVDVQIEKDDSKYGMPMPEELEELLAIDEEAHEVFESLTPGKKRSVMHMINSAKRVETRINRAIKIVDNLKMGVRDPRHFLKS